MPYKYLNDELVSEAKVDVDDRGFRFGDGVFELVSIFDSTLYLWEYHIKRLVYGLEILQIEKCNVTDLHQKAQILIKHNNIKNGLLRITITRGVGSIGYEPKDDIKSTILIETLELRKYPKEPINLHISSWQKPSTRALPVYCKTLQGLNSILSKIEAKKHNCFESLLLNDSANIVEVSSGNIFWFKSNILHTPNLSSGALPGIVRRRIIELSPYKVIEGNFSLPELFNSEGAFITNTSWIALSVNGINVENTIFFLNNTNIGNEIAQLIMNDKKKYSDNKR